MYSSLPILSAFTAPTKAHNLWMMNNHRINRIRIAILDEMRKINRKSFSIANVKRYDVLQRRYEKCNILLYGMAQPFNNE